MANGVEFAYALLTSSLFEHNEQISANLEGRPPLPIMLMVLLMNLHGRDDREIFGQGVVPRGEFQLESSLTEPAPKVQMKELQYDHVVHGELLNSFRCSFLNSLQKMNYSFSCRLFHVFAYHKLCNKCRLQLPLTAKIYFYFVSSVITRIY